MGIVELIANERRVEGIIDNINNIVRNRDDLVQEIYMVLLNYDEEKLQYLYDNNQLNFFLVRIIKNQYFSSTSPFHKKYRRYYDFINDGDVFENNDDDVEELDE